MFDMLSIAEFSLGKNYYLKKKNLITKNVKKKKKKLY